MNAGLLLISSSGYIVHRCQLLALLCRLLKALQYRQTSVGHVCLSCNEEECGQLARSLTTQEQRLQKLQHDDERSHHKFAPNSRLDVGASHFYARCLLEVLSPCVMDPPGSYSKLLQKLPYWISRPLWTCVAEGAKLFTWIASNVAPSSVRGEM